MQKSMSSIFQQYQSQNYALYIKQDEGYWLFSANEDDVLCRPSEFVEMG